MFRALLFINICNKPGGGKKKSSYTDVQDNTTIFLREMYPVIWYEVGYSRIFMKDER
jgi:hypothetical protein